MRVKKLVKKRVAAVERSRKRMYLEPWLERIKMAQLLRKVRNLVDAV
jgi:hypothetical protein